MVHGGTEPENMEETNLNFRKDFAEEDGENFEQLMKELGTKGYCIFSMVSCQDEQKFAIMGTFKSIMFSLACAMLKEEDLYELLRDAVTVVSNYKLRSKTPEKKLS